MPPTTVLDSAVHKRTPPYRTRSLIARRRLFARLGSEVPLILIVAPAGWGKTALLSSWVGSRRAPAIGARDVAGGALHIWYSLDSGDRDPARLVAGIAAAANATHPGLGNASLEALATGAAAYDAIVPLLWALDEQPDVTLILDNCDQLIGAHGAEALIEHVMRNRPSELRLVLAGRTGPFVPVLASLAAGTLCVLGREDLAFTADEAAVLLDAHGLAVDAVDTLVRTVRGWPLGLVFLSYARADRLAPLQQPVEAFARTLFSESIAHIPDLLRSFLLESALLGPFNATDAEAILDRPDSRLQVTALAARGLFVEAHHEPDGPILRYHVPFGGVLAAILHATDPDRFHAIHIRAALHFAADPLRALAHAAAAGDLAYLARLLDAAVPALREHGLWETVIRYGELVPDQLRSTVLLHALATAYYLHGEDGLAITAAEQCGARAATEDDQLAAFSALALRARPLLRQDRCVEALALCGPALEAATQQGLAQAEGWLAGVCAEALLRAGRLDEGRIAAERAVRAYRRVGREASIALARFALDVAAFLIGLGDDRGAEHYLDLASHPPSDRSLQARAEALRATVLLVRGDLNRAYTLAQRACQSATMHGDVEGVCVALLAYARACYMLARFAEGSAALAQRATLLAPAHPTARTSSCIVQARGCLQQGDLVGARQALGRALGLDLSQRAFAPVQADFGVLSLAEGNAHHADQVLAQALAGLSHYALRPEQVRALILRAEALVRLHRPLQAIACLMQAGELAVGTGWITWFARVRQPVPLSLGSLSSRPQLQGKGRELLAHLLHSMPSQRLQIVASGRADPGRTTPWSEVPGDCLRFSPFGKGRMDQGTTSYTLWQLRKARAREVLAFAFYHARPLSRAEILKALWPHASRERKLREFYIAWTRIQEHLGAHAFSGTPGAYTIGGLVEDAYRQFLTVAAGLEDTSGSPSDVATLAERGLAIYTGEYLPWCRSAWAEAPRTLARAAAVSIIRTLITARERLNQLDEALEVAGRGLAIAPHDDGLRCSQLSLLLALGRTDAARMSGHLYLRTRGEGGLDPPSATYLALIATAEHG